MDVHVLYTCTCIVTQKAKSNLIAQAIIYQWSTFKSLLHSHLLPDDDDDDVQEVTS